MKLSEIKGERTFDVIADLIDPIANIAEDKAAADLFRREKLPEGQTVKSFLLKRVKKALPPLLKRRKGDFLIILATIEGKTLEEYSASLDMAKLLQDVAGLITDEVFRELFISAQSVTASGSAQENTEGQKT